MDDRTSIAAMVLAGLAADGYGPDEAGALAFRYADAFLAASVAKEVTVPQQLLQLSNPPPATETIPPVEAQEGGEEKVEPRALCIAPECPNERADVKDKVMALACLLHQAMPRSAVLELARAAGLVARPAVYRPLKKKAGVA